MSAPQILPDSNRRPALVYAGRSFPIKFEDGALVCLTDLWRAAGEPKDKEPAGWWRDKNVQEFAAAVARNLNMPVEHIWQGQRGRYGGAYSHWQIAANYAKYLSPEFNIAWNNFAAAYIRGYVMEAGELPTTATASPISDLQAARQAAELVRATADAFLQSLEIAARRGLEFSDTVNDQQVKILNFVRAVPELTHPKKHGYVYLCCEVVNRQQKYKFGKTTNPNERPKKIPGQMPTIIRNLHVVETDDRDTFEGEIKKIHKPWRDGKTEWFRLTPQQIAAFCNLPRYLPSTDFQRLRDLLSPQVIEQVTLL